MLKWLSERKAWQKKERINMQYKSFLIKYAEIGVKGKNRFMFEDALVTQIRHALKDIDGDFMVVKESGRIYATAESEYDFDEAVETLKRIFGTPPSVPWFRWTTMDMRT